MGLETATYIGGLTPAWPLSGDLKAQGDDHIRLLKATLQATFPSATKPFYFPKTEAISGTLTLDATDQNNLIIVDTTAGNVVVNLPSGFTSAEAGWKCEVVKTSADVNAALVTPASGTITSKAGSTATIRVGIYCEPAKFIWTGSAWICSKPGPNIGSTEEYNGSTVPYGYLAEDGSAYNSTNFAELFAVTASSNLRDKRGRVSIADGTGSGLTARVNGTTYGAETMQLAVGNLPAETPAGTISASGSIPSQIQVNTSGTSLGGGGGASNPITNTQAGVGVTVTASFSGTAFPGRSATAFGLLQPSIGVKKIIRAC